MDDRKTCENEAAYRFTWPGRDESFVCESHAAWVRRVATAMGLHLQLIALEGDVDETCRQQESATESA